VWGPCDGPSQFPLLKGSPSRRPRARGAGPHECGGRVRTASRRAPQSGARVLPLSSPAGAAPDRGGAPAGARGYAPSPCGGHGGGGPGALPRVRGGPAKRALGANRGAPSMAPPAPPLPVESCPGGVARGVGLRGPGAGASTRPQGLIKRGVGGGQTGRPSTTGRHRSPHRYPS